MQAVPKKDDLKQKNVIFIAFGKGNQTPYQWCFRGVCECYIQFYPEDKDHQKIINLLNKHDVSPESIDTHSPTVYLRIWYNNDNWMLATDGMNYVYLADDKDGKIIWSYIGKKSIKKLAKMIEKKATGEGKTCHKGQIDYPHIGKVLNK
jgi:hypothetical protein